MCEICFVNRILWQDQPLAGGHLQNPPNSNYGGWTASITNSPADINEMIQKISDKTQNQNAMYHFIFHKYQKMIALHKMHASVWRHEHNGLSWMEGNDPAFMPDIGIGQ